MRNTRTIFIAFTVTLIAAIALSSCNLDATDGIYSEIADSTESTSVTLKSYLGKAGDYYYYLTDKAVCRTAGNNQSKTVFSSSETETVLGASLLDSETGALLVLRRKNGPFKPSISYYATPEADAAELGQFNELLTNGLFHDGTAIYRYNAGVAESIVSGFTSVEYYLENGDYAFFCVKTEDKSYKYYVIKADGTKLFDEITGPNMKYVGFQPLSSGTDFILLDYDSSKAKPNLYLLANGDTEITSTVYATLKSSLPYIESTQSASFLYTDDENTYIVFKCSSYFDKVRIADDKSDRSVTPISTGFAVNLRTADITNILDTGTANIFIAGTIGSMLYKIDMNTNKAAEQIK